MLRNEKGFLSLIGLLVALAIISFLCYNFLTVYFKKPVFDQQTQESLKQQGMDVSNYQTVLDSARKTVEKVNKQQADYQEQLDW